MSEISYFVDKNPTITPYKVETQLYNEIMDLIDEYHGQVSIASVAGVLELIKNEIFARALRDE